MLWNPSPPTRDRVLFVHQEYLETEVECVRRLRERARAEGTTLSTVKAELFEYEGTGMPILVSRSNVFLFVFFHDSIPCVLLR